jgi:propanol-preferring alcohol dehydrogenase
MVDQCKDFETDGSMRVMSLAAVTTLAENPTPLTLEERPIPRPGADQVRIRVSTCGVCHTELDEIEGRTPPAVLPMTPGHQAVGTVMVSGPNCRLGLDGKRVGVAWIHHACGRCTWCLDGRENLCPAFCATGRDAPGGYAQYMVVPEAFAHPVPDGLDDEETTPLLCAGAVGYRALDRCRLEDGQALGLTGFGASGHLVLQMARHLFPASPVYVFARSAKERAFALELGACWAGDTADRPDTLLDAIIDTTPAWLPVIAAMEALAPGGRLVINAIRKEAGDQERLAGLDYDRHLWREKSLSTVANVTRADVRACLDLAVEIPLKPRVERYPLADANRALLELRQGGTRGAKVLEVAGAAGR